MDYEKEQARLLRLFEEVTSGEECDDEEETGEEDNIEERPDDSDTEQEFNEDKAEEMDVRGPYFVGRDKRMKWGKHCPPKNVRTRKEDLTIHLPGAKDYVKGKTLTEIWECLFDREILDKIVNFTNVKIESL
ncbi:hypothetical protein QE152_g15712 [Popillia japonica]|uniref:Uncharacterized protein n=1 Tax=Popillia japonica TaxID=7064 RepID=A0AAW1L7N2_POPJA